MKKFLALSSLAAALLVTGCSQRSAVDTIDSNVNANQQNANQQSVNQQSVNQSATQQDATQNDNYAVEQRGPVTQYGSVARDNFATTQDRINYIDKQLQNVFFDFDRFVVRPDMWSVIDNNANVLTSPEVGPLTIRIEGNTDEWGTDEDNYALGLKRAVAVKDALIAKGVDAGKTLLVSYGESKPTCTAKTRECWAENRKVTFKMLP